jgi:hypothetical protein
LRKLVATLAVVAAACGGAMTAHAAGIGDCSPIKDFARLRVCGAFTGSLSAIVAYYKDRDGSVAGFLMERYYSDAAIKQIDDRWPKSRIMDLAVPDVRIRSVTLSSTRRATIVARVVLVEGGPGQPFYEKPARVYRISMARINEKWIATAIR